MSLLFNSFFTLQSKVSSPQNTLVLHIDEMQAVKIQGNHLGLEHLPLPSNEDGIKLATVSSRVFDEALLSAEVSSCRKASHVAQK